jgi:cytochrome c553
MQALSFFKVIALLGAALLAAPFCSAQVPASQLAKCAACHGEQGVSVIKGTPSLAAQPKLFIENQLVLIREGVRDVPAMKAVLDGVSDTEISELAKYFSALPLPKPPAAQDAQVYARGEKLSKDMRCSICHLPTFLGREQIPRLAGQQEEYLLHSMLQFRSGQAIGRDSNMAAAVIGVSDQDLKDLSYYFSKLSAQ